MDYACIGPGIYGGGDSRKYVPEKIRGLHLRRRSVLLEPVPYRDQIHGDVFIIKLPDGFEHDAVLPVIKVLLAQDLTGLCDGIPVHEHGAYHRHLCLDALGSYFF